MLQKNANRSSATLVEPLIRDQMKTPPVSGPTKTGSYLPTLDGWRALAIIAVMLTHDSLHTLGRLSDKWLFLEGGKGVDVFFAISGILICSRLMDEEKETGRISLRDFYTRRVFRILPAAIFYLATIGFLSCIGIIKVYRGEWWASLFFYRNYTRLLHMPVSSHEAWFTGHFWSLSVEEHFYIVLPALLVLFRKRNLRIYAMLAITAAVILHRSLELRLRPYDLIYFHTDVRLDALMIPAMFAVLIRIPSWQRYFRLALKHWIFFFAGTLALIASSCGDGWKSTGLAITMPCIVMGSVLHSNNWSGRLLECRALKFVGKISYSLYLWQMLFFTGHLYTPRPLGLLETFPCNAIATFLLATMSYYWIEKPMVKMGHRIAPPATFGRP